MPPTPKGNLEPEPIVDRDPRLWRRAVFLVSMLQGTMALEGQAVSSAALDRLREMAYLQLLQKE
jgi:hypothetical protein